MAARMLEQGVDHLWLDATGLERFAERFPTIAAALEGAGLDPATDWLPIAPAAHYTIGGVVTDLDGATELPGLWAAGEVACTGVHGANRLASNSLLEGMVFAARVVEAIERGKDGPEPTGIMEAVLRPPATRPTGPCGSGRRRRRRSPGRAGRRRQAPRRAAAGHDRPRRAWCATTTPSAGGGRRSSGRRPGRAPVTPEDWEHRNLLTVGAAVVAAARARLETRGAHTRTDYPDVSPGSNGGSSSSAE